MKTNDTNKKDVLTIICYIVSSLSWISLSINNWISLPWLYNKKYRAIWNIYIYIMGSESDLGADEYYAPIQMYYIINYIVFNLAFIIIFIGCIVFFVKTLIKKDNNVYEGMMGKFSRFHFFPLLCAFALSVLGELGNDAEEEESFYDSDKTGLALSLAGLISMVFIYIKTDFIANDWWSDFFLKKGTFSCLIVLFWYNFCYVIYYVRIASTDRNTGEKDISYWAKGCGIFFSILFGICCVVFSFIYKDLMVCIMNLLIYIGMAIYYFLLPEESRNLKENNKNADGVIDIIGIALSFVLLIYIIDDKHRTEGEKMKQIISNMNNTQNKIILKANNNSEQIDLIRKDMNLNNNS